LGFIALQTNTTGAYNTAVGGRDVNGYAPLANNSTGSYNVSLGTASLANNTTASENTAVGYQSGYSNTTGTNNTFMGYRAGYTNQAGNRNTFIGYQAGTTSNATGGQGYNTFIGYNAGVSLTTGFANTFIGCQGDATGYGSGHLVTTGTKNTIVGGYNGNQGGLDIRTASNYIVLSDGDGNPRGIFDSTGSFLVGTATNATGAALTLKNSGSATTWGAGPVTGGEFVVYNASSVGVYIGNGQTAWNANSDETIKNITGEIQNGLDKICTLRAAEFTWKSDETNTPQVGLIAQDLQKVLPEVVSEMNGILGVRYTEVIPLLVAAIKELKAEFDAYKATHP
jgi:hypothetical protein